MRITKKHFLYILLSFSLLFLAVACQNQNIEISSQKANNIQNESVENMKEPSTGVLPPYLSAWAKVVEIVSDHSLIVELIEPTWWSLWSSERVDTERNDTFKLLIGDTTKLVYKEDNNWISDVINHKIEVGTIIQFHYASYEEVTDLTQNPFLTSATGITVYAKGKDTVYDGEITFNDVYEIFSKIY